MSVLPKIVHMAYEGASLSDLEACAGKLWVDDDGGRQDADGAVRRAIEEHWNAKPGNDPYWDFLGTRGLCDQCGQSFKHENMAICPNCFRTHCYRETRNCSCGHVMLG